MTNHFGKNADCRCGEYPDSCAPLINSLTGKPMQFLPEELTLCVICGTMKHCTAGVCGRCSKKDKHDPAIQTYLREMIDGAVREERDRITKEVKELIEKYEPAYEQEDKACIAGMAMTLAIINTPNEL